MSNYTGLSGQPEPTRQRIAALEAEVTTLRRERDEARSLCRESLRLVAELEEDQQHWKDRVTKAEHDRDSMLSACSPSAPKKRGPRETG